MLVLDIPAEEHVDIHLRKLAVEALQIAASACCKIRLEHNIKTKSGSLYKPTHVNHPAVKWASGQCEEKKP